MNYISTRGASKAGVTSAHAIKQGLADDGGLFMPSQIPTISGEEIKGYLPLTYQERATKILAKFLTDYTEEELAKDTAEAYKSESFSPSPAPVVKFDNDTYILELWHGPTCAFKDMALQIMPRLFVRALRKCGEKREALILVATSGDTGKAALEGYADIDGAKIQVFYPTDGVSHIQKLQMQTQRGDNVSVLGIKGNFDDAQSGVKSIFADEDFVSELDSLGVFLSSANSINWGRLVPQVVYYVSAYCDLINEGRITLGDKIDVCVPTGNFGNIFACYIAKLMGLPVEKLVCASNSNNVLTDFIATGVYDKNRDFYSTISPSMDILISSNLERLLYVTLGTEKCAKYMGELNKYGKYALSEEEHAKVCNSFVGYYTGEEQTKDTIKRSFEEKNCLIDTHTAVALSASERYMNDYKTERVMLVVSTASPYKFANDVLCAVRGEKAESDVKALNELQAISGVQIPAPLSAVVSREPRHKSIIDKTDMRRAVKEFAKG